MGRMLLVTGLKQQGILVGSFRRFSRCYHTFFPRLSVIVACQKVALFSFFFSPCDGKREDREEVEGRGGRKKKIKRPSLHSRRRLSRLPHTYLKADAGSRILLPGCCCCFGLRVFCSWLSTVSLNGIPQVASRRDGRSGCICHGRKSHFLDEHGACRFHVAAGQIVVCCG